MNIDNVVLAIVGLGYVGLPLAVEFGSKIPTIGFDISQERITELNAGYDHTLEVSATRLQSINKLSYTSHLDDLHDANVFIVTVPTPVDEYKQPIMKPLLTASASLGGILKQGDIVIYESTVYPGATEEECVPVLEAVSGLSCNVDFFVGYSPERINPGDHEHRLTTIKKVIAGSTPLVTDFINGLYQLIIEAGTYPVSSIRVAEAAKVIENTQRDLNIALMNELSIIFNRMDIDTEEVLQAAGTKWNFLPFRPGLVGGHCISVDPYYLTHKAQSIGYHPEVILAGRRINDNMGRYVVSQLIKAMVRKRVRVDGAHILLLGLTFKENCPDLRNTRVIDVFRELQEYNIEADVCDPWIKSEHARREYGLNMVTEPRPGHYDAILLVVAHQQFSELGAEKIRKYGKRNHVFYDLKSVFSRTESDLRL